VEACFPISWTAVMAPMESRLGKRPVSLVAARTEVLCAVSADHFTAFREERSTFVKKGFELHAPSLLLSLGKPELGEGDTHFCGLSAWSPRAWPPSTETSKPTRRATARGSSFGLRRRIRAPTQSASASYAMKTSVASVGDCPSLSWRCRKSSMGGIRDHSSSSRRPSTRGQAADGRYDHGK